MFRPSRPCPVSPSRSSIRHVLVKFRPFRPTCVEILPSPPAVVGHVLDRRRPPVGISQICRRRRIDVHGCPGQCRRGRSASCPYVRGPHGRAMADCRIDVSPTGSEVLRVCNSCKSSGAVCCPRRSLQTVPFDSPGPPGHFPQKRKFLKACPPVLFEPTPAYLPGFAIPITCLPIVSKAIPYLTALVASLLEDGIYMVYGSSGRGRGRFFRYSSLIFGAIADFWGSPDSSRPPPSINEAFFGDFDTPDF